MPTYPITAANDNGTEEVGGWTPAAGATFNVTDTVAGFRVSALPSRTFTFDPGYLAAPTESRTVRNSLFRTIGLRLQCAGVGPLTITLDLIDETDPAAFVPGSFELSDGSREFVTEVATHTFPAGGFLTTVTLDLFGDLEYLHGRVGWSGRFAFRLSATPGTTVAIGSHSGSSPPALITTETAVDTGIEGLRWVGSGIYRDFKTDEYVRRDEAVHDGYRTGRYVHPDNWDPPDDRMFQRAVRRRQRRDRR